MLGLPDEVRACLFDLDGVLTDTASVHKKAWKAMFDDVSAQTRGTHRGPVRAVRYRRPTICSYIDGKPREDGVRSMSGQPRNRTARRWTAGSPATPKRCMGWETARMRCSTQTLRADGVEVFEGSRRYLEAAASAGLRRAVVSSSANTREVLDITGLAEFVEHRVDGVTMRAEHLPRQTRARQLRPGRRAARVSNPLTPRSSRTHWPGWPPVAPATSAVVVGVDRVGQAEALRHHGADIVVTDLAELLCWPR